MERNLALKLAVNKAKTEGRVYCVIRIQRPFQPHNYVVMSAEDIAEQLEGKLAAEVQPNGQIENYREFIGRFQELV